MLLRQPSDVIEIDAWEKQLTEDDFAPRLIKACESAGIASRVTPLPVGDIRFISAALEIVLIERKSTKSDLFTSLSKRLPDQLTRLVQEADEPILLIDGPLAIGATGKLRSTRYTTNWHFSTLQNFLLSAQRSGVHCLQVHNAKYTPEAVIKLYNYYQKTASEHTSLIQSRLKPFPTKSKGLTEREQKLRTLMSVFGVGPELASRLLDTYGSVANIGQASLEGLKSIPGVGDETANRIKEVLG
jgi:ERCC4-type nuclease